MTKKALVDILAFAMSIALATTAIVTFVFYAYSKQTKDIVSFLSDIAVYLVAALIFVVIVALFISIKLVKKLYKPIEELGNHLDDIDSVEAYDELMPFINSVKESEEKYKALDKQKKQFTANVSHELKTPLTSIAGYAELIEAGIAKPEDIKPFAGVIRKQALRLVTLSEDIIRLSQLEENDDQKIVFESVDLFELANRCVEALTINAKNKNVQIVLHGESCYVRAKSTLVEELIYNLCDNAIRYNKENGSVDVFVEPIKGGAILTVKDTGIGIPEKYQDRIFERFFRVDKSRSKATGGTGLGLAIVKHIVKLHNADLSINSVEGQGTTITITFNN